MNTLTVSVILLVVATIAGVAIVNLIQTIRGRSARRGADNATTTAGAVRGGARQARFEPVLTDPDGLAAQSGAAAGSRFDARHGAEPNFGAHAGPISKIDADIIDIDPQLAALDRALAETGLAPDQLDPSLLPVTGAPQAPAAATHAAAAAGAAAGAATAPSADAASPGTFSTAMASAAATSAAATSAGAQIHPVPSFAEPPASTATSPAAAPDPAARTEPAPRTERTVAYRAAPLALDQRVDCIVEFQLPVPWSGQRLLQLAQANRRVGSKPVLFEASTLVAGASSAAGTASGADWSHLRAEQTYRMVRAGVLLANRHGPLNAMEFSEFLALVNRLGEGFDTAPSLPDMAATLQKARQLDAECIKLDAQLGLNIDCADAVGPSDLARVARENALAERGNNRYARLGSGDEVLFSLSLSDKPNRVTLLLDVPRAPVDQKPWPALLACAHACLAPLQGHVVDDSGRPLNSRNLDSLSAELAQRYAMLDQSGFKAGSSLALRVFN